MDFPNLIAYVSTTDAQDLNLQLSTVNIYDPTAKFYACSGMEPVERWENRISGGLRYCRELSPPRRFTMRPHRTFVRSRQSEM